MAISGELEQILNLAKKNIASMCLMHGGSVCVYPKRQTENSSCLFVEEDATIRYIDFGEEVRELITPESLQEAYYALGADIDTEEDAVKMFVESLDAHCYRCVN